jgi:two-component system chemotaxis sensor kinase CheA
MEEFKKKFIEDAKDLVNELETSLLELEKSSDNPQIIEKVFRAMHTLKGTAGMYGFDNVGRLTHALENIYDEIRSNKLLLDIDILQNTFISVDLINYLLTSDDQLDENLKKEFDRIIQYADMAEIEKRSEISKKQESEQSNFFYVLLTPNTSTFKRGVNLEATLEEIQELGNYQIEIIKRNLPNFEDFEPTNLYLNWEILLATENAESIEDVFMFFLEDEFIILPIQPAQIEKNKELLSLLKNKLLYKDEKEAKQHLKEIKEKAEALSAEKNVVVELIVEEEKRKESIKTVNQLLHKSTTQDSVRVPATQLDELMNLVSELVIIGSRLELFHAEQNYLLMDELVENVNKISRNFRDIVLNIRLVPLNTILVRLNRLVHDLARDLDKKIDFVVEGADTELDKTIINNLEGPLMHIIRNSIDHGIETEEERIAKGKSPKGIVRFIAFYSGTNVFIQVQDDGKGINPDVIHQIAIEKGFIDKSIKLSRKEIYNLITLPGFTTAKKVTEISGRGVGMDVVKQNISDLRGEIEIDSEIDLGTSVTLKLPLTLSIIDSLHVKLSNQNLIIPLSFIDSCEIINEEKKITAIQNNYEYNGRLIPLINLAKVLSLKQLSSKKSRIIVLQYTDKHYALEVDQIFGEHQAVIKPLGEVFGNNNLFSGATILGDGSLAFIIDVIKLLKEY